MSWMTQLTLWGFFSSFMVSWLLNFIEYRCVLAFGSFDTSDIRNYIKIIVTLSVPVNQFIVEQDHKEFNCLADEIAVKYEQLDSWEFGTVCTLASMPSLPNWHVSFLIWANYVTLNLPMPIQLRGYHFFKYWRALFRSKFICKQAVLLHGGCSFVPIDL